jgi:REP element-mobilizing transposase RayT
MPEHIHLLISEPVKGKPSTLIQALRQRVSRGYAAKSEAPFDNWISAFQAATIRCAFGSGGFTTLTCGVRAAGATREVTGR